MYKLVFYMHVAKSYWSWYPAPPEIPKVLPHMAWMMPWNWNGFENDMASKHGSLKTITMYVICPLSQMIISTLSHTFRSPCMTLAWCMDIFALTCSCLLQPDRSPDIRPSNSRMASSFPGNSYHTITHQLRCEGDERFRFKSVYDCRIW